MIPLREQPRLTNFLEILILSMQGSSFRILWISAGTYRPYKSCLLIIGMMSTEPMNISNGITLVTVTAARKLSPSCTMSKLVTVSFELDVQSNPPLSLNMYAYLCKFTSNTDNSKSTIFFRLTILEFTWFIKMKF